LNLAPVLPGQVVNSSETPSPLFTGHQDTLVFKNDHQINIRIRPSFSSCIGANKDNAYDRESIFISNYAVLPPEPTNSLGSAVLKYDVGVPGLPLP
jgi:hypothetical protein